MTIPGEEEPLMPPTQPTNSFTLPPEDFSSPSGPSGPSRPRGFAAAAWTVIVLIIILKFAHKMQVS